MGNRDYYKPGDWNVRCDLCGMKRKASECRMNWKNQFVCSDTCWVVRHPQDFVRGIPDYQAVPIARPANPQTMGTTTVRVTGSKNARTIDLTSVTGIASGDAVGIVLDDGTVHWSYSSGTPVGTVVTLGSFLPGNATVGNTVYLPSINSETYTTATALRPEDL